MNSTAARSTASTKEDSYAKSKNQTSALYSDESESADEEQYDPVFVPDNFKKTNVEKQQD